MIRKPLLLRIFDASTMQRWNDKLRPVELVELDKQSHKMIVAYMLAKFEEQKNQEIDWTAIIEGSLFEFLQRLTITDLKPDLLYNIKNNKRKYLQFNRWVVDQMTSYISPLGPEFCSRFREYLYSGEEDINRKILNAAHYFATDWEFKIIERANPKGFEIEDIRKKLDKTLEKYSDLYGITQLAVFDKYRGFIDLCGELRFQIRWSHMHRAPKTSVLGHMYIVAILSYLFSLENSGCRKRCFNNYFTGLFHDLPELLTKDVVATVKESTEGISSLIKQYEKKEMTRRILPLLPIEWQEEMVFFTENEFSDVATVGGARRDSSVASINAKYNRDVNNPRDGSIVDAADKLAAFIEAYLALRNGIENEQFDIAMMNIRQKYEAMTIGAISLWDIYADFY